MFVSRLWQIHIFGEGNTRTTAVFFIKYLRTLGFSATNNIFADNAWYFRNALIRANYTNLQKGIHETTEYLELFFKNLLLNEKNTLRNRNLHISGQWTAQEIKIEETETDDEIRRSDKEKVDIREGKAGIEGKKVDIREEKADIGREKIDIEISFEEKAKEFSSRTASHIRELFDVFGYEEIFGRREIVALLELRNSSASKLLSKLVHSGVIEPVSGCGKGRYKFRINNTE